MTESMNKGTTLKSIQPNKSIFKCRARSKDHCVRAIIVLHIKKLIAFMNVFIHRTRLFFVVAVSMKTDNKNLT